MDYSRGYESGFDLCEVDSIGANGERIGGVATASATRSVDGDAPVIDSGSVEIDVGDAVPTRGTIVRLHMTASSEAGFARPPVFTGVVNDVTMKRSRGRDVATIDLKSVLTPASEAKLEAGWYAPTGADGALVARDLLRAALPQSCSVSIDYGKRPILTENYVAGTDEAVLKAAWGVLGDWQISLTTDGNVIICPIESEPYTITRSMICSDITDRMQNGKRTLDYTREWSDEVLIGGTVIVEGYEGTFRVTSQRLTCKCGTTVAETLTERGASA